MLPKPPLDALPAEVVLARANGNIMPFLDVGVADRAVGSLWRLTLGRNYVTNAVRIQSLLWLGVDTRHDLQTYTPVLKL